MMNMLKSLLSGIVLLMGMGGPGLAAELDSIVAVINEDVITRSELDQELALIMVQLRDRGTALPPHEVLEHQVLERMITKRLQLQTAERLGLQVDDATLGRAIDRIATRNNMSLTQLHDTLEQEGLSFARFRENTREQILIARLQAQEVINRITVTDQEIDLFLHRSQGALAGREAVHLQHILVAMPDGATPNLIQRARDKIERLRQQLREGADFSQLALVHSDGRQALEGGDLGWIALPQVPTIASEVARTLKAGEISEPIRSASGFHLFRVAEVKGEERHVVTQTHARHILIKTNELISDQEAQTRLEQLRIRLVGGEAFDALARSHSEDTASAIKGGDLGWVNPGDTVPAFEEQMASLAPGEISAPFRSPFGWHLLQVLERRQHDSTKDILKSKARENLRARKAKEATDLWLRRLRDESYVEIRLDRASSKGPLSFE